MFSDEIVGVVDFPSSWKKERTVAHSAAQTREIFTEERAILTEKCKKSNQSCQTDVDDKYQPMHIGDDNSPALLKFLRRVEPAIVSALQRNAASTAFDGYASEQQQQQKTALPVLLHTLTYEPFAEGHLEITSAAWNSTGSVVAASYGRFDHEDWCTHKAGLCTWNLNRRTVDGHKPDSVLEVDSCVMTVAFHPRNPALVAGGTFNGEVCVWNLSRETDSLVTTSGLGERTHRDPVTKVVWLSSSGTRSKLEQLMSISLDGRILVWTLNEEKRQLELSDGFILTAKSMPKSAKVKSAHKDQEMGITYIAFSHDDNNIFYLGSESGGLFKCALDGKHESVSIDIGSIRLKSPVSFSFAPHAGPTYSVDCSPFHRNLFITSSSDTSIRLHTALQSQPALVLEPSDGIVFAARWSPTRPLVFAAATERGHVLFYDLKVSQTAPVLTLDATADGKAIHTLEFNSHQRRLLATGDALGSLKVWQLSDDLTSEAPAERELLGGFDVAAAQD